MYEQYKCSSCGKSSANQYEFLVEDDKNWYCRDRGECLRIRDYNKSNEYRKNLYLKISRLKEEIRKAEKELSDDDEKYRLANDGR